MIVYSAALLSASVASQSLKNARIGYQTWLRGLEASAVTVSSETTDGPKDMPLHEDTATYWEPSAMPATWEVDFGGPEAMDYVGLAGHSFGTDSTAVLVETSTGATVGSPSVQVWTTFASSLSPANDDPILFLDTSIVARYVRITLTGSTAPKLAVVYAGEILAMSEPIRGGGHAPLNMMRSTVLHQSLSNGGQFLGQEFRRMGVTGKASFENLDPAWYRSTFDPFVKAARRYPYFFAWRPEQYPLELGYVWTDADISPSYMGQLDWMQVQWKMTGIGNE